MIEITDRGKCIGCNACASVCPKQCISLLPDKEGFWYPSVKKKKCINCDLCVKTCPVLSPKTTVQFQKAYAAYAKDDTIRMESSSGGVFSLLAEYVLDNGGVVFGAAFNDSLQVEHICVENKNDLAKLRMSKYVQSSTGNVYSQAKKILESKRLVLFTGTPCQIAGLRKCLNREFDNLYTQDIVCHGVPSPWVWEKNKEYLEKQNRRLKKVRFRDKTDSWKHYHIKYGFETGETQKYRTDEDLYFRAYLGKLSMRPSCYVCKFKDTNRASDITLADFWGIEDVIPEMDNDKGTTLVICNNAKGELLFNSIMDRIVSAPTEYSIAVEENPMAVRSVTCPGSRDIFFQYLRKHSFEDSVKLFCGKEATSVKKVQLLEDYLMVKKEKGILFALIWKYTTSFRN